MMDPTESPVVPPGDSLVPLESVLCTEELHRRPSRPPDYETENRALVTLVQALADSPRTILQKTAEIMLETLRADSSGFSLLTKDDGGKRFHWPAIAGAWKPHIGGGTPREFGPCGDVLDCNAPLMFTHLERRYTYFQPVTPQVEECLLVPFYVGGKAVGTIWVIAHDDRRKFDAEDLRQLVSLGRFASSAYQAVTFHEKTLAMNEALLLGSLRQNELAEASESLNVQLRVEISERNLAEEALRASEDRYRTLFNSMDEGYCIIEIIFDEHEAPVDYRFLEVNPSFEKQSGLHAATGKRVRELVPNLEAHWFDAYGTVALTGEPVRFVNESKAMGGRWFDLYAFRVGGPGSRKVAVLFSDISERRRVEGTLRVQAEALADLHRRKDEFLAMLSHELRNPLAPLSNAVQLLRLQQIESPLQQQARNIIERQVGNLTHLVDDLLEISRVTTGRIQLRQERVLMSGIVQRAVETARPLMAQGRHELTLSLPPQPIWLNADAARLEQVVVNLLNNAAKYTDEGGHIWLAVESEGDTAVLRVRDTGIGIAPELLPRIFDLFTQAERSLDRSQGGLGIGLCLVQRLVDLHGGTVEAYSVLGQGSEFVVRLPVMLTSMPPLLSPSAQTTQLPKKGHEVLVVDDNVDAAQAVAMLLTVSGHEARMAFDGPSALEAALAHRPDVVLLDIGLPGLDGFEVAKLIRQQPTLKDIVLIAVTGYGQEADRQRSLEAGFDHHLVKPADFDTIQKILASLPEKET